MARLSSLFLELRSDPGWTDILHQVNVTRTHGIIDARASAASLYLLSRFSNSEEAKSTAWLHPVTGEAVITGHRKTPGKYALFACLFDHALAAAAVDWIKGDKSR